jgi:hypothetical protein
MRAIVLANRPSQGGGVLLLFVLPLMIFAALWNKCDKHRTRASEFLHYTRLEYLPNLVTIAYGNIERSFAGITFDPTFPNETLYLDIFRSRSLLDGRRCLLFSYRQTEILRWVYVAVKLLWLWRKRSRCFLYCLAL